MNEGKVTEPTVTSGAWIWTPKLSVSEAHGLSLRQGSTGWAQGSEAGVPGSGVSFVTYELHGRGQVTLTIGASLLSSAKWKSLV